LLRETLTKATVNLSRKALVVDDDAGVRLMVKRLLLRNNFDVDTAHDGAEAIEKLGQTDFDVIVLDLMMPTMDGSGVVKYLEEHRPGDVPRVIVMTAFGKTAINAVSPPVGRCIEKPFDIDHLLREVTECCWMSA
jgi:DNA-binding response OmpR family regulator